MTKTKTFKFDENSPMGQWVNNQEDFSKSVRKAIDFIVNRYGTGDLFDSIVNEAMGNTDKIEPVRGNEPRVEKKTVTSPKREETTPVTRPKRQIKTKKSQESKKIEKSDNKKPASGKKRSRGKINLNMLSD